MAQFDATAIAARLGDLGQFGIHLTNPRGICFVCKKPISKEWSSGIGIDPRCQACSAERRENEPAYTRETIWVRKMLDTTYARVEYRAIVKIDGVLYEARQASGSSYHLYDLAGKEAKSFALQNLPSHCLPVWWTNQGETVTHAFVAQFYWPREKETVSHEVHYRSEVAKEIPIYDIGHNGRGIQEEGEVFLRLYLMPTRQYGSPQDFDVLAIQLVKSADDPYLDNYEVAVFPKDTAVLKWSQVGSLLVDALSSLKNRYVDAAYLRAMHRFEEMAKRHPLPADWWIVLRLDKRNYRELDPTHQLRDILLLPGS